MGTARGRRKGARVSSSLALPAVTTPVGLTFLACGFFVVGDSHMHLGEFASCEASPQGRECMHSELCVVRVISGSHLSLQPNNKQTDQALWPYPGKLFLVT